MLIVLLSLASPTGWALDAESLGTWCELSTADFRMVSDLERADQHALVAALKRLEPVAEPYLPGTPVAKTSALKLVVFSRRDHFRTLTGKRKFAGFMQPSLQTNRLLVGPNQGGLIETAQHEYTHYLLRNRLDLSLPPWFDEGLSMILGNARFSADTVRLGELPTGRLHTRVRNGVDGEPPRVALNRTLNATSLGNWPRRHIEAFYDWSWLLVHYLYFGRLDGAPVHGTDLETYLANGTQPLAEFLGMTSRGLLRALDRHLRRAALTRDVPSPPVTLVETGWRCLDSVSRDLELARAVLVQNPDGAARLIDPHLETHPDNVDLLVVRARIARARDDNEESRMLIDQALALAPANAEALILKADLIINDCLFKQHADCAERWQKARSLYRAALKRDPQRFDGVLGLALANLYTGRPGEAVNYMKVAYARAPWAALVNFYLGESYRLIGDTRARGYLVNARNWATLPVWQLLAEESLKLLDNTDTRAPASAEPAAG